MFTLGLAPQPPPHAGPTESSPSVTWLQQELTSWKMGLGLDRV